MLSKNFYSYMRAAFQRNQANFITTNGEEATTNIDSTHTGMFEALNKWANNSVSPGVQFGTGTTPATASDYFLQSILTPSQIDVSTPSAVSYSRGDTFDEYSVSFGVTNKTADAITISEVGLIVCPYANNYVLVDRTLLDEPVTIPAGQSKQITYTIRFNY